MLAGANPWAAPRSQFATVAAVTAASPPGNDTRLAGTISTAYAGHRNSATRGPTARPRRTVMPRKSATSWPQRRMPGAIPEPSSTAAETVARPTHALTAGATATRADPFQSTTVAMSAIPATIQSRMTARLRFKRRRSSGVAPSAATAVARMGCRCEKQRACQRTGAGIPRPDRGGVPVPTRPGTHRAALHGALC